MSKKMDEHEKISRELLGSIPRNQIDAVFNQSMCDIEPAFMGFVQTYKLLAVLIPKNWTVIDFGCAYNPQSFYFTGHTKHIAIDPGELIRFKASGTDFYNMSAQDWMENVLPVLKLDLESVFAICSYVPDLEASRLVRAQFPNVYTFYPHGENGGMPRLIK